MSAPEQMIFGLAVQVYPPLRVKSAAVQEDLNLCLAEIAHLQAPILKRQKRKSLSRYDLLTHIEQSPSARHLQRHALWQSTAPSLTAIRKGKVDASAFEAFSKHPYFEKMTNQVAFEPFGKPKPAGPSISPWDGQAFGKKDRCYPVYQMHLKDASTESDFNADLMLLLIAMVEVREAVVQQSITNRPKLATCAFADCSSWFALPFMSARSRFCSSNCRINHLRKSRLKT